MAFAVVKNMARAARRSSIPIRHGFRFLNKAGARRVGLVLVAILALDVFGAEVGSAQGWLYGWAPPSAHARHRKARPGGSAPRPETPGSTAAAPLPVPRPRFPTDDPPAVTPPALAKVESPTAPAPHAAPSVAPSGARLGEAPGQPEDDATCPARLKARDIAAASVVIGPQPDPRCAVVEAVRLTALTLPDGHKVDFPDAPTIACATADAFTLYVRDLLVPLAKGSYGAPVASVWTGPGLECRARDHIFGAKLSAHGQGLAVDIAQIKLADGHLIAVGQPKTPLDEGFETAARAAGCGYFHTVLGPGSDSYHRTHWHFDLEVRGAKGDSKYCK